MKYLKTYILIFISFQLYSQQPNKNVLQNAEQGKFGYQKRTSDERYEGLFKTQISGSIIEVVSVTQGDIEYQMNSNEVLRVALPKIQNIKETKITGVSYGINMNYQIDMVINDGKSKQIPLREVILPQRISSNNLGIFGYIELPNSEMEYVPVIVSSKLNPTQNSEIKIKLASNVKISQVKWKYSVYKNGECNPTQPYIAINTSFEKEEAIELVIPNELKTTKICIEIQAQIAGNNRWIPKTLKVYIP
ncbi:hypothetical protein GCM10011514_52970 [Emticicia aquatilis]|uniref:Uncharacterized protein n=1 Tax=Emticicia aquatilis TaxID=1537369 RepID=A0A916Z942_9BACT|nr:hypothetical protein [Emticicia aquatilis]GGD82331.1 hypothetical protein GCM10011514_52970 [Emticicia aquatilis]